MHWRSVVALFPLWCIFHWATKGCSQSNGLDLPGDVFWARLPPASSRAGLMAGDVRRSWLRMKSLANLVSLGKIRATLREEHPKAPKATLRR
jgi:hypothetical protein